MINSIFGFGFALVSMTILSFHFELELLGPLMPLLFLSGSCLIVCRERKEIQYHAIKALILVTTLVAPLGVYLGKVGDPVLIKVALGSFIISFSCYNLLAPKLPQLKDDKWAPLFGFFSGLFGGAYNIPGPPMVIYGTLRQWSPQAFRVTLQAYFLYLTLLVILSHIYLGSYQAPNILNYFLYALPAMLLAVPLGKKINSSITNVKVFNKYVYILMLILGTVTIIKALDYL